MSAPIAIASKIGVTLLRLGMGVQKFELPEGATLADFLREAGVEANGQEVMVDGRPFAESAQLQSGMIVSVTPKQGPEVLPWVATFGMFRDDPDFPAFVDRVQARRDEERGES